MVKAQMNVRWAVAFIFVTVLLNSIGFGFILGPVIGGFLGEFGPRTPFFVTAGIAFANALFGLFAIPETLKEEDRRPFRFARANPLGAFRQVGRFPLVTGILGAYFSSPAAPVYFPGAAFALAGVLTAGSALTMVVALSRIPYRE